MKPFLIFIVVIGSFLWSQEEFAVGDGVLFQHRQFRKTYLGEVVKVDKSNPNKYRYLVVAIKKSYVSAWATKLKRSAKAEELLKARRTKANNQQKALSSYIVGTAVDVLHDKWEAQPAEVIEVREKSEKPFYVNYLLFDKKIWVADDNLRSATTKTKQLIAQRNTLLGKINNHFAQAENASLELSMRLANLAEGRKHLNDLQLLFPHISQTTLSKKYKQLEASLTIAYNEEMKRKQSSTQLSTQEVYVKKITETLSLVNDESIDLATLEYLLNNAQYMMNEIWTYPKKEVVKKLREEITKNLKIVEQRKKQNSLQAQLQTQPEIVEKIKHYRNKALGKDTYAFSVELTLSDDLNKGKIPDSLWEKFAKHKQAKFSVPHTQRYATGMYIDFDSCEVIKKSESWLIILGGVHSWIIRRENEELKVYAYTDLVRRNFAEDQADRYLNLLSPKHPLRKSLTKIDNSREKTAHRSVRNQVGKGYFLGATILTYIWSIIFWFACGVSVFLFRDLGATIADFWREEKEKGTFLSYLFRWFV